MNNNILKGESTNIFTIIFRAIWKGIKSFLDWYFNETPLGVFTLVGLVVGGASWYIFWEDSKANPKGNYEMVYRVYYNNNTVKEYTIKHDYPIICGSSDGKNYINKRHEGRVIETTAPIEVVRYVNYDKHK